MYLPRKLLQERKEKEQKSLAMLSAPKWADKLPEKFLRKIYNKTKILAEDKNLFMPSFKLWLEQERFSEYFSQFDY